jgi:ABC-2 type transport system permease protein
VSTVDVHARPRRARRLVQIGGFLHKEVVALLRQPRLLLVLVAGPFLILLLFGIGYDQQQTVLRTAFVGPEDSIYEETIDQFADDLSQYVVNAGYSDDLVAAEQQLRDDEIDAVVVFPADPIETVLGGEQAEIKVIHDKIDPIQQVAVEVSSQVAVMELNARVLEEALSRAQDTLVPIADSVATASALVDELGAAVDVGDQARVDELVAELEGSGAGITTVADATGEIATALGGDDETLARVSELQASADELAATVDRLTGDASAVTAADVDELTAQIATVGDVSETVATLDPNVVVRPFASDTASLQREPIAVIDYFAPAAVALLLQHMVLTFAAMSLVADRGLGLFEVYRVGPVGAGGVMVGKYLAFVLVGAAVSAALLAAITQLLDVPMRGELVWVVVAVGGLLLASIGLGMVLSLLARSDVQAVQFSMLALLAALFFGGFFLDLDAFDYPVKLLSWALPVSYGIRMLRDVMLRGIDPNVWDLVGLGATTFVFALVAWILLHRQLRVR